MNDMSFGHLFIRHEREVVDDAVKGKIYAFISFI
jgi:hypothetical protein